MPYSVGSLTTFRYGIINSSSLVVFERPGCFGIPGVAMRGWLAKLLGNRGENAAVRYLRRQGYRILARNCRSHWGEIDIIARDGDWIVFVEVKTRSSHAAGHPAEAVTRTKQLQLTKLALAWLKQRRLLDRRARFDVVALTWPTGAQTPEIEHFVHAFPAADV